MRIVVSQDSDRTAVAAARKPKQQAPETHESKVLYNQALEFLSRNRPADAMATLEQALQISPRNANYLSHYGLAVALEREDYESAIKLCERAARLDPRNPVTHVNLGRVYRMTGRNAEAYDEFLCAWKTDRKHPGPATELSRMGIRRPPVLPFLPRSNWLNIQLGRLRAKLSSRLSSLRPTRV
jgi:tetratricopeptide (TPR) repeat protein